MKSIAPDFAPLIFFPILAFGCALAQQSSSDNQNKHVKDLRAEQTQAVIFATPLCQQVNAVRHHILDRRETNPAAMETDLSSLMQKSDEVILASNFTDNFEAVSPSGKQAITYYDLTVLRTWKGSHKVGDLLTIALPWGAVHCGMDPPEHGPDDSAAITMNSHWGAGVPVNGPYVLFLRQSRGDETQVTPGLRLAAGDGTQGLFALRGQYDYHDKSDRDRYTECLGVFSDGPAKCIATLESSQETVKFLNRIDRLKNKYEGMPVPNFLKEVQSVARSRNRPHKNPQNSGRQV